MCPICLLEWNDNFNPQMEKLLSVSKDLHSRVPDSTVEKAATRAALQSLLEYHDSFSLEVEREKSILALLVQQTLSLRGDVMEKKNVDEEEAPCLQEIRSMQEQYDRWENEVAKYPKSFWFKRCCCACVLFSLLLQVQTSRAQVHQELKEREDVEKELGLVKGWIQDTRGLLLSPTADLDSLLQELEVCDCVHTDDLINKAQTVW